MKIRSYFFIWILLLRAFNNYLRGQNFAIFCPLPLIIKWFLLILTKVDKQAAAIASPSPFWLMVPCDPALKAINPKIKMKPPRDMCGMEWPEMNILSLSLKRSMRGPRIIAPERRRHHSFNSIHHLVSFPLYKGTPQKSDNLQYDTLVFWDKWLVDQASDVPSIIFFSFL